MGGFPLLIHCAVGDWFCVDRVQWTREGGITLGTCAHLYTGEQTRSVPLLLEIRANVCSDIISPPRLNRQPLLVIPDCYS